MNHDTPDKTQGFRRKGVDRPLQGAETDRPGRPPSLKPEQRWCGCKIPKDYPQIDIHTSKCLRKAYLSNKTQPSRGTGCGNNGTKKPSDESQVRASDARSIPTTTHQSFFRSDGSLIKNHRGTKKAWRAFDNRRRRNAGELK